MTTTRWTVGLLLLVGGSCIGAAIAFDQPIVALLGASVVALVLLIPRTQLLAGFVVLLAAAALTQPLSESVNLFIGPVRVEPIDLGMIALLALWMLGARSKSRDVRVPRLARGEFMIVIGILSVPIVVGLAIGNDWQSVLRAGRVLFYYGLFFLLEQAVDTERDRVFLMKCVVAIGVVGAAHLALSRVMGWQWQNAMSDVFINGGTVSRGFGWWSAMPWIVYGSVGLYAFSWLSAGTRPIVRWVAGGGAIALAIATVSTLIRGDFVGLVIGLIVVTVLGVLTSAERLGEIARLLLGALVFAGLALGLLALLGPSTYLDVVTERLGSILGPAQTSLTAAATREYRVLAMLNGVASGLQHPVGVGFGYPSEGPTVDSLAIAGWTAHSVVAWVGFFLGWLGSCIMAVGTVSLGWFAARQPYARGDWTRVAAAGVLAAMLGQSLAANVLFGNMFTYPLVPVLVLVLFARRGGDSALDSGGRVASS